MSQPAVGGRESRLIASGPGKSTAVEKESPVTVKTVPHLPNASVSLSKKAGNRVSSTDGKPNAPEHGLKSSGKNERQSSATSVLQKNPKLNSSANGSLKEKIIISGSGIGKSNDDQSGQGMEARSQSYPHASTKSKPNKGNRSVSTRVVSSQPGSIRTPRVFTPTEKSRSSGANSVASNRSQDSAGRVKLHCSLVVGP